MYSSESTQRQQAKLQVPKPSQARQGRESTTGNENYLPVLEKKEASLTHQDNFRVRFDIHDPKDPQNFSTYYKAWITVQLGALTLTGSLGTSIVSPAESAIAKHFDVSLEMTVLTVALFVLG